MKMAIVKLCLLNLIVNINEQLDLKKDIFKKTNYKYNK